MSMNVGDVNGEEDAVIAAINTTPLVDVMLVMPINSIHSPTQTAKV